MLNPLEKEGVPMHVDHVVPITSSSKKYKFLLVFVDGFTKYTWVFPTKSTDAAEVINKLRVLQQHFSNLARIVSDCGSAFRFDEFHDYCKTEGMQHLQITIGVP